MKASVTAECKLCGHQRVLDRDEEPVCTKCYGTMVAVSASVKPK